MQKQEGESRAAELLRELRPHAMWELFKYVVGNALTISVVVGLYKYLLNHPVLFIFAAALISSALMFVLDKRVRDRQISRIADILEDKGVPIAPTQREVADLDHQAVQLGISIVSTGPGPSVLLGVSRMDTFHLHICNRLGTRVTIQDLKLTVFANHYRTMDLPPQGAHTDVEACGCRELAFGVDISDAAKRSFERLATVESDHILSLQGVAYLTVGGKNFQLPVNQETSCRIHLDPESMQS